MEEKDPKRLFEGNALIRRLVRVGVLDESRMKLDYVLALKVEDFLERRLQTCVYKLGLAKSIHHARVLIRQRHIRYALLCYSRSSHTLTRMTSPALGSKLSMSLLSLSVLIRRSISILLSHRPLEEGDLDVLGGRRPKLRRRRTKVTVVRKKKSEVSIRVFEARHVWL